MRRTLTIIATTVGIAALQAVPALATEGGGGSQVAKGSGAGILLAAVFGLAIGTYLTIDAYRSVRFGQAPGHQEHADDIRQGMSEYEPDIPEGSA